MKIDLLNTPSGLKPMYDKDYEEKKKLKIGESYQAEIKLIRNIDFHRKYFALINLAWEYQNEKTQLHFKTINNFRKYIEVSAGHCDIFYSPKLKEWVEVPKSISFSDMDNGEFSDLYEMVKNVIFSVFLRNISEEEFISELSNF